MFQNKLVLNIYISNSLSLVGRLRHGCVDKVTYKAAVHCGGNLRTGRKQYLFPSYSIVTAIFHKCVEPDANLCITYSILI